MSATLPRVTGLATISLTEADVLAVLGDFLTLVLLPTVNVVRAEINRVPEPLGSDYVVMTPILRDRFSTNADSYVDVPGAGQRLSLQSTRTTVQLDVHGPAGADNAQILSTLLRGGFACDQFVMSGFDIVPLYTSEPRQAPFLNGEQQIEIRWTVDAVLQANIVIGVPQQFAGTLAATPVPADLGALAVLATPTPT